MKHLNLLCRILGHPSRYIDTVGGLVEQMDGLITLASIAAGLERLHDGCTCGRPISHGAVWRANLVFGRDASASLEDFVQLRSRQFLTRRTNSSKRSSGPSSWAPSYRMLEGSSGVVS